MDGSFNNELVQVFEERKWKTSWHAKENTHLSLAVQTDIRAQEKVCFFISIMSISSPNPMSDHLLESSHRDDPNK